MKPLKSFGNFFARCCAKIPSVTGKPLIVASVATLLSFLADETLVDKALTQLAARLFSPVAAYVNDLPRADHISDRLVIVDIDAASARNAAEGWPFSYGHHARVLEQIRRQKPKALFIDIQFESDRADPSLPRLLESLCRYKADGIPVFMAAGSESLGGKLRPELDALRTPDQQPCFEKVAVGYEVASDQLVWTYPLRLELGETQVRSAGLAMAEVLRGHPIQTDHQSRMGLTWLAGPSDNGPLWRGEEKNESDGEAHYCRESALKDVTLLPQIFRSSGYDMPYCPRHASVIVDWVTAPRSETQRQELFDALNDRVVLYGVSFDPNDHITSPLHGRVPGVYLHAQAADNLTQYGNDWRRPTLSWSQPTSIAEEWGLKIVVMFGLALFVQSGLLLIQFMGTYLAKCQPVAVLRSSWARLAAVFKLKGKPDGHSTVKNFLHHLLEEAMATGGKLFKFWLGLVVAFVLSLVMEGGLHVSVIGYASLLCFVLAGEVFVSPEEHKERHEVKSSRSE